MIPTLNRLPLLQATVASVQAQVYGAWELVIVDDGSSDGTTAWVSAERARDPRIRLVERSSLRSETHGAQVCRNLGLQQVNGEVVLFLDSDDLLAPDCLHRRQQVLQKERSLDAVVGQAGYFQDQPFDLGIDKIWGNLDPEEGDLDRFLAHAIPWQTSGPLWRREALNCIGPWDERLQHVGHDHEFHVRALCRGVRFRKLAGVDYFWRVPRNDSLSSLESFKLRHRDGGMITAYRAIIAEVMGNGCSTSLREAVMAREVIRLMMDCRNFGGSAQCCEQGLLDAAQRGLLPAWKLVASRVLLRCWWRIGGRLPAMALLNRLAGEAVASR
ncbi:glycosyltransferase family A protein [Cyanobium sp. Morenito 9A2]|uniref:glycosyltransferase family 2 protein n=1 Tax=Cyanobium sp. Morenito 9A2 TaxID=2823718 RepID=UPI0020CC2251|nr:glycosyltransferase family A protein [Cyanobium sp. Morenito 9A2]